MGIILRKLCENQKSNLKIKTSKKLNFDAGGNYPEETLPKTNQQQQEEQLEEEDRQVNIIIMVNGPHLLTYDHDGADPKG